MGKADSAKLFRLFEFGNIDRGGCDPNNLDSDVVNKVREKHFPNRKQKNFREIYKKRAAEFLLDKELQGARRRNIGKKFFYRIFVLIMKLIFIHFINF